MSGGMGGSTPGVDPPTTTKGDLSGFDTTFDRVPIGSNTQVLTADSSEALGLKWATAAGGGSLELLDIHIATGAESNYTFTPSSALTPADYQEFWVFIKGESTLAYDLQLILNRVTATYQYNGWRNSNGTTDVNDKGVNATEFKISLRETLVKDDPDLAVIDPKQKIIGTYIHGWLESLEVTQKILSLLSTETFDIPFSFQETKEREMDELALFLEEHCEVEKILRN